MKSGKDIADETYLRGVDLEAEWLREGATAKVDSIETLLRGVLERHKSLLELGCGTGAVITEIQRRGIARELTALDYSEAAVEYLRQRSQGIRCIAGDVMTTRALDGDEFDVVVASHVLEHLEDPRSLLRALPASISFRYLILEVPLDDLLASRIKNRVRDRRTNAAGHVQFFTPRSFDELVTGSGFEILRRHRYVPVLSREAIDILASKDRLSRLRRQIVVMTGHYLPRLARPFWERYYYAHYAVLCRVAA
jgi:SAM-dependent methyltransferase